MRTTLRGIGRTTLFILAIAVPGGVGGQSFRGLVQCTARYFQLETISLHTGPRSLVDEAPNGALNFEVRSVFCVRPWSCSRR